MAFVSSLFTSHLHHHPPFQKTIRRPRVHHLPIVAIAPHAASTSIPSSTPSISTPATIDIAQESLLQLEWDQITQNVLRHCSTSLGRQILAPEGMLAIAETRDQSENLLQQTCEASALLFKHNRTFDFDGVHPVAQSAKRCLKGGVLNGKELIQIAQSLSSARQIRRQIESVEDVVVLKEIVAGLRTWPEIEQQIRKVVDDYGEVVDAGDPQLRQIRTEMREVGMEIVKRLNGLMARESQAVQERIITQRYDRYVIPVKVGMANKFGGVVHDSSASGQTVYVEPASVKGLNDRLKMLKGKERGRISAVLRALSEEVVQCVDDLQQLEEIVGRIDAAVCRARVGREIDGVRGKYVERGVKLTGVRHALLIWKYGKENVVAGDYIVEKDVKCVCVTGPNTGGKTVLLKTLGTSVLMMKAGLFISAKEVCVPFFDNVLTDVGDAQDIVQNLSTFSGHVKRVQRILDLCCDSSLVLLDEVGGGTDPSEGAALGVGLLRYLKEKGGLTVATTHHGELKGLKYREEGFENASVEFDEVELKPTFKVLWGVGGRSNALKIANRLGLDEEILSMAKEELGGGEVLDVVERVERERREIEDVKEKMEEELGQVEEMKKEWEERVGKLKTEEGKLRNEQRRAIDEELRKAKREIGKVVREMQRGGNVQAVNEKLGKIEKRMEQSKGADVGEIQVGERVRVSRLGQVEVVQVGEKELVVSVGGMRAKVKRKEVVEKAGKKVEAKKENNNVGVNVANRVMVRTGANTVDVRGERVDAATVKVDQMIDKAIGLGVVWIIHGHGTGRLRSGVREFLKQHALVERIEDAKQEEGGTGVTIAYLL